MIDGIASKNKRGFSPKGSKRYSPPDFKPDRNFKGIFTYRTTLNYKVPDDLNQLYLALIWERVSLKRLSRLKSHIDSISQPYSNKLLILNFLKDFP